jgi:hypothetical protein
MQTMFEAVVRLMGKWQRFAAGMTKLLQKPSKRRWKETAKLCNSVGNSSGRVWAKNWYTFISNFDYEILQMMGVHPKKKKIARVSPCFWYSLASNP